LGFHKGNELVGKNIGTILQGTGKSMRHIRITKIEDIQSEVFYIYYSSSQIVKWKELR